jgi:hypothetical protein
VEVHEDGAIGKMEANQIRPQLQSDLRSYSRFMDRGDSLVPKDR